MPARYAPTRYVRVSLEIDGRRVTRIVMDPKQRGSVWYGFRANMDGSKWEKESKDAVTTGLLVFSAGNITAELRLNLHYGELEITPGV